MMQSKKELIYKDNARKAVLRANPASAYCIDNIKPVDAVEVVRCKDCIYNEIGSCTFSQNVLPYSYAPDWFCADGEKKEN